MSKADFTNHKFRCYNSGIWMTGVNPEKFTDKNRNELQYLQENMSKPKLTENMKKELLKIETKLDLGETPTKTQLANLKKYRSYKGQMSITPNQIKRMAQLIERRDSKPVLSKTAITQCGVIWQEVVLNRSNNITAKYMEKGLLKEEESLTLVQKVLGRFMNKYKHRLKNDYFSGNPDHIGEGKVVDIKTSWDAMTFPLKESEPKDKNNKWQVNSYMDLTHSSPDYKGDPIKEAEIIYCLVDTPPELVNRELRKLDWDVGIFTVGGIAREDRAEVIAEVIMNHTYTIKGLEAFLLQDSSGIKREWFDEFRVIPDEHRVKVFHVDYDADGMEMMKHQLDLAREEMNNMTLEVSETLVNNVNYKKLIDEQSISIG